MLEVLRRIIRARDTMARALKVNPSKLRLHWEWRYGPQKKEA